MVFCSSRAGPHRMVIDFRPDSRPTFESPRRVTMPDFDTAQTDSPTAPSPVPSEISPPQQSNRSALLIVFLVVFIDLLGFGIILPLLPRYADSYLAALLPGRKEDPLGGVILGLLMSSFSAMQFLFAPLWGRVSDHVGRRPILLLGLFGSVVFYLLFGFASDLPAQSAAELAIILLFVARLGAGIAGATLATAQAVIADSTPPEKRKHGMALIGAAFGIGFTFGPLIGFGSLRWFSNHPGIIGYVAAGLSGIALLLGFKLLPETRRPGDGPRTRKWIDWGGLQKVVHSPALWPVVMTFFLATFGFGMFEPTLALLLQDALQLDADDSFLIFAFIGLILLLAQGLLYRRLAHRVSEATFMFAGILLMALGLACLGGVTLLAAQDYPSVYPPDFGALLTLTLISLAIAVVGFALLTPSAQALVSRRSDPAKQGEMLGVNQSASALARILGPAVGLPLYKLESSHLLPYAFGTVLLLLMLPLIPRIRRG
jgi:DHA1 family tetracycline resistance protein-like MFS transporter